MLYSEVNKVENLFVKFDSLEKSECAVDCIFAAMGHCFSSLLNDCVLSKVFIT
jgi:hypothetical protein